MTRGAFNVPLTTFLGLNQNYPGGDNSSWDITARELIDLAFGGSGGINAASYPDGFKGVMERNLRANWPQMVGAAIGIPIAFKIGTKLLRKPVITPMNRMIKMAGLGSEVKV